MGSTCVFTRTGLYESRKKMQFLPVKVFSADLWSWSITLQNKLVGHPEICPKSHISKWLRKSKNQIEMHVNLFVWARGFKKCIVCPMSEVLMLLLHCFNFSSSHSATWWQAGWVLLTYVTGFDSHLSGVPSHVRGCDVVTHTDRQSEHVTVGGHQQEYNIYR